MQTKKIALRRIVRYLNNPEEEGGFWLPNIQRNFVWTEEQICRLFDSILREYPISTLLVWKTKSNIKRRKFIDNFFTAHRSKIQELFVPEDDRRKCLVLDGQQRLQSLYIGLQGSYDGRELYLDILSGESAAPDDIAYKFSFIDSDKAKFPNLRFKDIVYSNDESLTYAEKIIEAHNITDDVEKRKVSRHISLIFKVFSNDDAIPYIEIDSIDWPEKYKEDDVVEIFIRANSGGTSLSKSDLLFSLLNASWDLANDEMEDLLDELNRFDFNFSRDFVLKTCLTLLNQGAKYEVRKFRTSGIKDKIESNWNRISDSIKDVLDFVRTNTYIQCDKALPSYLVLIPIIYARYNLKIELKKISDLNLFIIRSLITQAFSGSSDTLIDSCINCIKENNRFDVSMMFDTIKANRRSLQLTETQLFEMGYDSKTIHLLFNLWYKDSGYSPAFSGNMPQIDHIFPQSALKKLKTISSDTGRPIMKYVEEQRNQLANCMLLTKSENGAGNKWDILPEEWFVKQNSDFFDKHLIPKDRELWKIDNYEYFIEERKIMIREKFLWLLRD